MLIEVCVDTAANLAQAIAAGADRIELCTALASGGLTPSAGFMYLAAQSPVPVFAMIRPRPGDFVFSPAEMRLMCADIAMVRSAGLAGVVLGASLSDGRLDAGALATLTAAAQGLGLTLHRAFDLVPDLQDAVEAAIRLGFDRILTSGRAATAALGEADLARTIQFAAGRIGIMPGAGIGPAQAALLRRLGVAEAHGSFATARLQPPLAVAYGFAPPVAPHTDPALIRALRLALTD